MPEHWSPKVTEGDAIETSILIVTYNCSADVRRCVDSLRRHLPSAGLEILIHDNGSRDAEELRSLEGHDLRIEFSQENLGFGKANNILAASARGRFLLFLNPDTILDGDVPGQLVDHLKLHPEVGACGPRMRNLDGSNQFSWNVGMDLRWELAETLYLQNIWRKLAERRFLRNNPQGPWIVDFSSGACLCISAGFWREAGGFDPEFFLNHEDIELCWRIRSAGKQVHVLPWAWITHADGGSQKKDWGRFVKDLLVAKKVYIRKRFHGSDLLVARLLWRIRVASRVVITAMFACGSTRTRLAGYVNAWKLGSAC